MERIAIYYCKTLYYVCFVIKSFVRYCLPAFEYNDNNGLRRVLNRHIDSTMKLKLCNLFHSFIFLMMKVLFEFQTMLEHYDPYLSY